MIEKSAIVYIIDGAGGSGFTPLVLKRALTGEPYEVKHFRWGTGYMRIINDLTNRENLLAKSKQLTSEITKYKKFNPNRKIYIVAKSAGTAVALNALADLPENCVHRVILMSPAVSPSYPLLNSLRAVRHDVVSFCSAADLLFLHVGTSIFGTADGIRGVSAGLKGFTRPDDDALSKQYSKLHEVHWEPSMMKLLHFGDHSGNSMPLFVKKYIVPLLLNDELATENELVNERQ
ncbi:MAG: hypothetical protein EKK48_04490 [Candidatus Melainabacteria bacterium]|nr:MAG: hypothetical protein EKK48_04490 [Candidatus Melainabacteria bacterium]